MSSREGVFAGYLRWCPGGMWEVFGSYVGVFARRGSQFGLQTEIQYIAFRLGGVSKMAVGGPGRPRQNITENRDDQTPSIILHRESDDVVASSLF